MRIIIVNFAIMLNRRTRPVSPKPVREQSVAEARVLPLHALFQGTRMLVIEHESERNVLWIARHGKLILPE